MAIPVTVAEHGSDGYFVRIMIVGLQGFDRCEGNKIKVSIE